MNIELLRNSPSARVGFQGGNADTGLCLKSTNRIWIGLVQGATWSVIGMPYSRRILDSDGWTRSLPLPVLTRSNNDFRLLRQSPGTDEEGLQLFSGIRRVQDAAFTRVNSGS